MLCIIIIIYIINIILKLLLLFLITLIWNQQTRLEWGESAKYHQETFGAIQPNPSGASSLPILTGTYFFRWFLGCDQRVARNLCNMKITFSCGRSLVKVRIYCVLCSHCATFHELYDFSWIMRSDVIWGRLCEIAPSHNIRSSVNAVMGPVSQGDQLPPVACMFLCNLMLPLVAWIQISLNSCDMSQRQNVACTSLMWHALNKPIAGLPCDCRPWEKGLGTRQVTLCDMYTCMWFCHGPYMSLWQVAWCDRTLNLFTCICFHHTPLPLQ